jgi:hypothetical protein
MLNRLTTRWASDVTAGNVWPEYPRPHMVREGWHSLNGWWEYAITDHDAAAPVQYEGKILVPYPVESALSGVKRALRPDQLLWYRRTIHHTPNGDDERLLLHFDAVDYEASVYLDGKQVGAHRGGYQRFTLDISSAIRPGANELVVKVHDPTEAGPNARGKQKQCGRWMFYSASSGLWQSVWLERVPACYIAALKITPDVDNACAHVHVDVEGWAEGCIIDVVAASRGAVVARERGDRRLSLRFDDPRLWSPDDPHLYDLQVRLLRGDRVIDTVKSYCGLRKIDVKPDAEGRFRIYLNDRYTFNLGVVDQGYWPDGLYTAPSDAALEFDVRLIKALGFNTVRKHVKIEPERWYYHCDRLGLMVWQDMPSASNDTPQARARFEQEIQENIAQLHNHPSITTWVLFNEGWGAYDPQRLTQWMKRVDPSRLVNGHSGPYEQVHDSRWFRNRETWRLLQPLGGPAHCVDDLQRTQYQAPAHWMPGDLADVHIYPGPEMFAAQPRAARVTGEYGSFGVYIPDHTWDELSLVGLGVGAQGLTPQQMLAAYAKSIESLKALEAQGLSGALYFQVVDVEREQQGFVTYDRAVAKVSIAEIEKLNTQLIARAANYEAAIAGFSVDLVDYTPESQRYADFIAQFRNGRRDLPFLTRLALMALRQGDPPQALAATNEFVAHAREPYTKDTWASLVAITHSSLDRGFERLTTRAEEANALLEPQIAQKKVLEIIGRELIVPYFQSESREMGWDEFERRVAERHGSLGAEAVIGARMMEELIKEDWAHFGASFVRYFATAIPRSPYASHSLCYQVLKHVDDQFVVETAVRVMQWQITADEDYPVHGRYDPIELDTYATLLRKLGRAREALGWHELAVSLSDERAPEVIENLRRTQAALRAQVA